VRRVFLRAFDSTGGRLQRSLLWHLSTRLRAWAGQNCGAKATPTNNITRKSRNA
jgi:hypothetical protein